MKLLTIVAVVLCILAGNAFGQSNLQGSSDQSQSVAPSTQSKAPEPDAQNNLTSTDSKSDSQSDEHHRHLHVRLGTIGVGAGYTRFSGPFFYNPFWFGYYPYGFYDPFFPSPFFAPGFFEGYSYSGGKGEVKLSGAPKNAEVFLNGGYAGTASKLKNIWLEPGAYDLSVATSDSASFHQRIYVLSGKTLKIAAKLSQDNKASKSKTEEKQ